MLYAYTENTLNLDSFYLQYMEWIKPRNHLTLLSFKLSQFTKPTLSSLQNENVWVYSTAYNNYKRFIHKNSIMK